MRTLVIIIVLLFSFLLGVSSYSEDFNKGLDAYNKGDFVTAFNEWKPLAEDGDANLQFAIGWLYANGKGIDRDYKEAVYWYQLAAKQGDERAQTSLALMYQEGEGVSIDKNKSYDFFQMAIKQGNNIAKYNAANLIINGDILEKSGKLALKLLEEARISGEIPRGMAENSIGWIYLKGIGGVKKDYQKSLYWGIEGGKKGATNAYSNVALQYFAGLGVSKNYSMMVRYLIKSLETFQDGDDWILKEDDEWIEYKDKSLKEYWEPREIYWNYVLFKDEKYIKQLEKLIN